MQDEIEPQFLGRAANVDYTNKQRADEALLAFVTGANLHPSLVENNFFRKFCFTIAPEYDLPKEREVVDKLDETYCQLIAAFEAEIIEVSEAF